MNTEVLSIVFPLWLKAFAFTLALEIPLFVFVARIGRNGEKTCPIWRQVMAGACGTCFTHPLLWFVWPLIIADYTIYIVSGELIIAIFESFTFFAIARPITLRRAVAASFFANAVSYGLGALLH